MASIALLWWFRHFIGKQLRARMLRRPVELTKRTDRRRPEDPQEDVQDVQLKRTINKHSRIPSQEAGAPLDLRLSHDRTVPSDIESDEGPSSPEEAVTSPEDGSTTSTVPTDDPPQQVGSPL